MIEVKDLCKHYRVQERGAGFAAAIRALFKRQHTLVRAVDGVSFSIEAGERVGFLGPNGAGKTTTLKMLAGLLHETSGEVRVDGHVPKERKVAYLEQIMLVMGQKQQLIWDLPPADTFELNRAIYAVPRARYRETLDELIALLDVGDLIRKPTRELSLGERMKCELIAALIHRPKILFLDEPTIGLDVSTQVIVRDFIRDYNVRHGATLILTSHYMDDVTALCPRVIVIDKGKLSYDGALDELVRKVRPEKRIELHLASPPSDEALSGLGQVVRREGTELVLQVSQEKLPQTVARALATFEVRDFTVGAAPLEEVMSEIFSRSRAARDSGGAPE
ncbi:MAG: ATP-binding cassette domain-containing protein [Sandaracinaceae bacterium]|nr:ATP-binding cassette domain-containing protein [Sandaracinaceae bacterium]